MDVRDERLECPYCGHSYLSVRGFRKKVYPEVGDPITCWVETCPSCKTSGKYEIKYLYRGQRMADPPLPKPHKQIFEGVFIADRLKDYRCAPYDLKEKLAEEARLRALAQEGSDGGSEEDGQG